MKKVVLLITIISCFSSAYSQQKTLTENFLNNVGDTVVVVGKIYGGAFLIHVKTKPTFLNLGDTSPTHRLIIRIEPEDRDKFPSPPETYFLNKVIQVRGKLQEYKGSALIQVSEPAMIKTDLSAGIKGDTGTAGGYIGIGAIKTTDFSPKITSSLRLIVPDSILQTTWIKSVAEKAAEEKKRNVHVVQKNIDLRTAPTSDAPLIAQLKPGMLVSILYTSKKWSYVSIGSVDGFNNVNGFIKHKRFKHLRKLPVKE
jgi:hypothetical protein